MYYNGYSESKYEYNAAGLRKSKSVNGEKARFVYSGEDIVGEIESENYYIYYRGTELLGSRSYEGITSVYRLDGHGSVIGIFTPEGEELKKYEYDDFGSKKTFVLPPAGESAVLYQWKAETEGIHNPFGYTGEYTDEETGLIYLRNRYYAPNEGRFITEDPIRDGMNWYVYANNNPIMFADPWGLFDYDTKLSKSSNYSDDVKVLQNELAWLGYYTGEIDGYFGDLTLNAVNVYKNANGLWNFGEYSGVVGVTTWESLGLIYRSKEDIAAGVEIVTEGSHQVFDITKPFNNLLCNVKAEAEKWYNKHNIAWFYGKVNHKQDWDIKREESWEKTLGITYPGSNKATVIYGNYYTTPEELGNFLYGYAGTAAGFNEDTLITGSIFASGIWKKDTTHAEILNEFTDHFHIKRGIEYYNEGN